MLALQIFSPRFLFFFKTQLFDFWGKLEQFFGFFMPQNLTEIQLILISTFEPCASKLRKVLKLFIMSSFSGKSRGEKSSKLRETVKHSSGKLRQREARLNRCLLRVQCHRVVLFLRNSSCQLVACHGTLRASCCSGSRASRLARLRLPQSEHLSVLLQFGQ